MGVGAVVHRLGIERHDPQLGDGLPAALLGMPRATIRDMASAATVLLAPDLKEELPVLYLRLRDAVVNGSTRIIEFTPPVVGSPAMHGARSATVPAMRVRSFRQRLLMPTCRRNFHLAQLSW